MSKRLGGPTDDQIWRQRASRAPVRALAVSDSRIVSGGTDGVVRIWDLAAGNQLFECPGNTQAITAVTFDAGDVVFGSEGGMVRRWRSGKPAAVLEGSSGTAMDVAIVHFDDLWLVAASGEEGIRLWGEGDRLLKHLTGHAGWVPTVIFCRLAGESRLVSGGEDHTVRIWDPGKGEQVAQLDGHTGWVSALASGVVDGRDRLVSAGEDGIRVWDPMTGEGLHHFGSESGWIWSVAFIPDASVIVSGGADGIVRIWDTVTGEQVRTLTGHSDVVYAVATTHDGGGLISAGLDGTIRLSSISTGAQLLEMSTLTGRATAVEVINQGERIVTGGEDGTVRVWTPGNGKQEMVTNAHRGSVRAVKATADGDRVVSGGDDGVVRVWSTRTGNELAELTDHGSSVSSLAVSTDGETVVSGDIDGNVRVWSASTATAQAHLKAHAAKVVGIVLATMDGHTYIASGGDDGTLSVSIPGSTRPPYQRGRLASGVHALTARSHDNQFQLVVGQDDGIVQSFVFLPREVLGPKELVGHRGPVLDVAQDEALGPRRVVSVGADGTVRYWDPIAGVEVKDHVVLRSESLAAIAIQGDVVAAIDDDGVVVVERLSGTWRTLSAHTALPSDKVSVHDAFGGTFDLVAQAVADFLLDPRTEPPVTIGIKGAWGGGKSTVMTMIRDHVDDGRPIELVAKPAGSRWSRLVRWATGGRSRVTAADAIRGPDDQPPDRARPGSVDDPEAAARIWRPTVWFNPWHFQTGEQVWAGLATTIIDQVTARMTGFERERFFLGLNWARVDHDAVRRRIHRALWRTISVPVAAVLALTALVGAKWGLRWALGGFSLASLATLAGAAVATIRSPLIRLYPALVTSPSVLRAKAPAVPDADAFVPDPGHRAAQGAAYLTYVDLKRVIDLVATPERPLVIFVDDLDRCSPSVVVQTLEALNLFLAGPYDNCSFVIAVEPSMLATHVATLYSELDADEAKKLGWRFLEKMIHLPVVVPRPDQEQAAQYLTSLLPSLPEPAPQSEPGPATPTPDDERPPNELPTAPLLATVVKTDPGAPPLLSRRRRRPAGVGRRRPTPADAPARTPPEASAPVTPAEERFALNLASSDEFRAACIWAAQNLVPDFNPRQLKRLLALLQLYTLIANRLGYLALQEPERLGEQIEQISVFAALSVRWPQQVDQVCLQLDDIRQNLAAAETLAPHMFEADMVDFLQQHRDALDMAVRLTTLTAKRS